MIRNYWIIAALLLLAGRQSAVGQSLLAFDSLNINSGDNEWLFINPDLCAEEGTIGVTAILISTGIAQLGNDSTLVYHRGLAAEYILSGEGIYSIPMNQWFFSGYNGSLPDTAINAISCDYQGRAYIAGRQLSRYDSNTGAIETIGDFPPGMRSGGGFTQQGGRFYMTTPQQELVLVDPEQPGNSSLLHTFPDSIDQIQGLASFPYTCDSVVTYVVTSNHERATRIYQMDMETYDLGPPCELEAYVLDVASDMECLLPPCELYTDLDADDSAGLPGTAYRDTTCTGPVPIADMDAEVFSPFVLDSLRIELLNAPDGAQEQLSCPGLPGIGVQGNGSGSLMLVNEGTESGEAFTQALRATVYENTAATPTLGAREIVVTMYSAFYGSMPSMGEIVLDTINPLTLAQDSASALCHGQADASVTLQGSGGLAPYRFQWADGVEDSTRTGLSAGSYVIGIADAQGCSGQDTLLVAEPDTLIVSISAMDSLTCAGSGQLTAVPQGGVPPYSYAWSSGSDSPVADGLDPGPHTVTVTDQNACTDIAGFTFIEADTSLHTTTATPCAGTPYNWQGQSFTSDTSLCLVYPSQYGCDSTHCLELSFISRASGQEVQLCPGQAYTFGGEQLTAPGTYRDTIQDGQACDSIATLQLSYYELPALQLSSSGSLCAGGSAILEAAGQGTFEWGDGSTGNTLSVTAPGTYRLTLTDANGCTATDSLTLTEETPDFTGSAGFEGCPAETGGYVQADSVWGGTPPYLFALQDGALQSENRFSGLSAGTYLLSVEDAAGCRISRSYTLDIPPPLAASLPADTSIRLGQSVLLPLQSNAAAAAVSWQPPQGLSCLDCLAPTASPVATTAYEATLTDSLGCTAAASVTVEVEAATGWYAPTAFSPNGDGRNDLFQLYTDASVQEVLQLEVYGRWGGQVFTSAHSGRLSWDGTVRGELAPAGGYIFQAVLLRADGREEVVKGEVVLLR